MNGFRLITRIAILLIVTTVTARTDEPDPSSVQCFESDCVLPPKCPIDEHVFGLLQKQGIHPARICSDAVFIRRVYLDAIGILPTADETMAFLNDTHPEKRDALIDRLLARDEFADYWAMKWSDLLRVKSEFPINLWPNAVQAYYRWIHNSLKQNLPYDQFAWALLTSSGSNFHDPQVNFYRAVQAKEPRALAQVVALTFMGVRADKWPEKRLTDMSAFFSQVGYKYTLEWKEEIVYFDMTKASNAVLQTVFPDGKKFDIPAGQDPRKVFATWLINEKNPWFARNIVNRIWSWLLGRGIVSEEADDILDNTSQGNQKLLTTLEHELIASHFDLKQIYRQIMRSQTYQLSSIPRSNDPRAAELFAFYPVRRLEAEVLIDALDQITGSTESYSSSIPEPFTYIPEDHSSVSLADASITSPFLELFGRSPRDSGFESERNSRPTADQSLHMLNSSHIQRKLDQSEKLRAILQNNRKPREITDLLYLTILSRLPSEEELKSIGDYRQANATTGRRVGYDLAWALINSAEFQYRH